MTEPSTALTVAERASVALGSSEHERRLVELAKGSQQIMAIGNAAAYAECHAARVALKRERINIERLGKAAREDAAAFAKAVIGEEKRLIGIIAPEEQRLQAIQDAHDERVAAEKAAKEKAERERVAAIRAKIDAMKARATVAYKLRSTEIQAILDAIAAEPFDPETFAEFAGEAKGAREATVEYLTETRDAKAAQEAEARRIAYESAELERQRKEQERQQAETRARLEAEERAAREAREAAERKERERIAAEAAAERRRLDEEARIAREAREAADAKARAEREEADRVAAEARAEQERLAREREERQEQQARVLRERQEAIARAEREAEERRLAEERRQREAQEAAALAEAAERARVEGEELARQLADPLRALESIAAVCADKAREDAVARTMIAGIASATLHAAKARKSRRANAEAAA